MTKYIALKGLNTPAGRFEPGEEVRGIPPASVKGLLKREAIKEAGGAKDEKKPKGGE